MNDYQTTEDLRTIRAACLTIGEATLRDLGALCGDDPRFSDERAADVLAFAGEVTPDDRESLAHVCAFVARLKLQAAQRGEVSRLRFHRALAFASLDPEGMSATLRQAGLPGGAEGRLPGLISADAPLPLRTATE